MDLTKLRFKVFFRRSEEYEIIKNELENKFGKGNVSHEQPSSDEPEYVFVERKTDEPDPVLVELLKNLSRSCSDFIEKSEKIKKRKWYKFF